MIYLLILVSTLFLRFSKTDDLIVFLDGIENEGSIEWTNCLKPSFSTIDNGRQHLAIKIATCSALISK